MPRSVGMKKNNMNPMKLGSKNGHAAFQPPYRLSFAPLGTTGAATVPLPTWFAVVDSVRIGTQT